MEYSLEALRKSKLQSFWLQKHSTGTLTNFPAKNIEERVPCNNQTIYRTAMAISKLLSKLSCPVVCEVHGWKTKHHGGKINSLNNQWPAKHSEEQVPFERVRRFIKHRCPWWPRLESSKSSSPVVREVHTWKTNRHSTARSSPRRITVFTARTSARIKPRSVTALTNPWELAAFKQLQVMTQIAPNHPADLKQCKTIRERSCFHDHSNPVATTTFCSWICWSFATELGWSASAIFFSRSAASFVALFLAPQSCVLIGWARFERE